MDQEKVYEGYVRNRSTQGLVLRTFARKPADVPSRVTSILEMVSAAEGMTPENSSNGLFNRIDIMVWNAPDWTDTDCGETAPALRKALRGFTGKAKVYVHEYRSGDLFCGILNEAVALQSAAGIDFTFIASTEALSYFTPETVRSMLAKTTLGARAVGVAFNEFRNSVFDGRLANTLIVWHGQSLLAVSGFDPVAAKPESDKIATCLRGHHDGKVVYYEMAGVEEVIPLARLVKAHGQCLAAVEPSTDQHYEVMDAARQAAKLGTKTERQIFLLNQAGYTLSWLQRGMITRKKEGV